MFPNPNYHEPVGPGVRWALRHLPFYGRWYRFLLFWPGCDKGLDAARVDPDYPDQQRAVSEINDIARLMFTDWITSQVGDDAELLAKVLPDYPATGQAHPAGQRQLAADPDAATTSSWSAPPSPAIDPDAVVTDDGVRHPADVIVYATGFRVNRDAVADDDHRPRRRRSAPAVG